jgi:hypothetical protein
MYGLGLTYILVDTEFKKTEQKLGELGLYAYDIGKEIVKIDEHLLFLVDQSTDPLDIKTINIKPFYNNNVISGVEYRAVILNHHYVSHPHLHILYTVLKYDIIKKEFYFDLFLSNTQYVKRNTPLLRRYCPVMSNAILEVMKHDIDDTHMLYEKIKTIKSFIYKSTKEHINYSSTRIHLKIQKSIHSYLKGKPIVDDTQLKINRKNDSETNPETNHINKDVYDFVVTEAKRIINEKKILEDKNYTVIATSVNLLKNNIIYEKQGEDDKHAEALLINFHYKNNENMDAFKRHDLIFVIRLYQNGSVGCGLPCFRCVRILSGNGVGQVVFSIDKTNYQILKMDENTYTYTTTGNKLLHIDTYLYDKYVVYRRLREE